MSTKLEQFISTSLLFLRENFPEWSQTKEDKFLRDFINKMIQFGREYNILKEINVQKLMAYKIEYDFVMPLKNDRKIKLNQQDFEEDYRMDQFYIALESNYRLIPITLESDLNELRGRFYGDL